MPDGEDFDALHFDMATWAKGHEKLDDLRFKYLFSVVGAGMCILVGICGWSLKTNYDNASRVIQAVQQSQYQGAPQWPK